VSKATVFQEDAGGNRPLGRVLERLDHVEQTTRGYRARCPAHDDRQPSLAIAEGSDGRVLIYCHAGCTARAIVEAVGLTLSDLFSTPRVRRS
jgi:hypothetical protein